MSAAPSGSDGRARRRDISTIAVHAGQQPDGATGALAPPLVAASTFVHGNPGGFEYGRDGNPTWLRLEEALAALEEGSAATVFSSGMATISAVVNTVPVGGRVVAAHNSYSGTRRLLADLHHSGRVVAELVDIADSDAVAAASRGAALCCLESITNPMLTVPDLPACIDAARAGGARVLVDNTFATPCTLRPLTLGADVVVHSLSKYAGGHDDLVLGAAVTRDAALATTLAAWRATAGAIPGQLEAWLVLRGLRTLVVRVRRQMDSAAQLAERLASMPGVGVVHYPGLATHPHHVRASRQMHGGFGGVVSIEVEGGAERAEAMCAATSLWRHCTSLGGVESTLERRARYDLDAAVVPESLVRLSVGIEDVDDLLDDLEQALASGARMVSTRATAG